MQQRQTGSIPDLFASAGDFAFVAPFPRLVPVRQVFKRVTEPDPAAATRRELARLGDAVQPGMRVAITVGSRGIRNLPVIVRAAGEWFLDAGTEPFVVPSMGSHGGATVAGQIELLDHLGISENTVHMRIQATMDTVLIGQCDDGPAVHVDAIAASADAILLVNRIKPHTDFQGEVESGLAKICSLGLGNQRGAEAIHAYGAANLARWVPEVARKIMGATNVLGGLAILENAFDETALITFLACEDIGGAGETLLLDEARSLMGSLPFDDLDVLVVDQLGKDKSGSGMDTNVIGRRRARGVKEFERPRIANISVHSISPAADGNGIGVGLADFIPFRVLRQIDLRATYMNALTAGNSGIQRAQLPLALPTDRDAIAAAILTCGRADPVNVSLVRIHDTLDLSRLLVSESLRAVVEATPGLEIDGEAVPLSFDERGNLPEMSDS
ncbi:MAG: DUF2088 domain-containing protein [Acidimicrobiales bacterium]